MSPPDVNAISRPSGENEGSAKDGRAAGSSARVDESWPFVSAARATITRESGNVSIGAG